MRHSIVRANVLTNSGDEEGGRGVDSLGKEVGDGSCPPDVGATPPLMAAKNSGKSIARTSVEIRGGGRETTTANDTTATMISKKSSHHSLQKVPTSRNPWKVDSIYNVSTPVKKHLRSNDGSDFF